MIQEELKIEVAASKFSEEVSDGKHYRDLEIGFIAGVKSDIAKEYHTKGTYTEEEVISYLRKYTAHVTSRLYTETDMLTAPEWFEQNKKK